MIHNEEAPPTIKSRRLLLVGLLVSGLVLGGLFLVNHAVGTHRDKAVEHAVDYSLEKADDKYQDIKQKMMDADLQEVQNSIKEKLRRFSESK